MFILNVQKEAGREKKRDNSSAVNSPQSPGLQTCGEDLFQVEDAVDQGVCVVGSACTSVDCSQQRPCQDAAGTCRSTDDYSLTMRLSPTVPHREALMTSTIQWKSGLC